MDETTWGNVSTTEQPVMSLEEMEELCRESDRLVRRFEVADAGLKQWVAAKIEEWQGLVSEPLEKQFLAAIPVEVDDRLPEGVIVARNGEGRALNLFLKGEEKLLALDLTRPPWDYLRYR